MEDASQDAVLNPMGNAENVFNVGPVGVGVIVGSLILASLPNKKRGLMLLCGTLILSLALVGFSFSHRWLLSLFMIAIVGLGQSTRMALGNTLIQYYTDDTYRGRVMSIYLMNFGLMGFGVFAAGVLAEAIGVQWAIGGFAAVLAVLVVLTLVFVPRIRKLD